MQGHQKYEEIESLKMEGKERKTVLQTPNTLRWELMVATILIFKNCQAIFQS